MKDMGTAPTDGTRILVKCGVLLYSAKSGRYVPSGAKWQECRFKDGEWVEWCGNFRVQSTSTIDPLGWAPLPSCEME